MRNKILELKKIMSLYEIALEMDLSETTLYNYMKGCKNISRRSLGKIQRYLKRREENENTTNSRQCNFQK